MDWEKYRRVDGSIDLVRVYNEEHKWVWEAGVAAGSGENFLIRTEQMHPTTSRQAATVAICTALAIAHIPH